MNGGGGDQEGGRIRQVGKSNKKTKTNQDGDVKLGELVSNLLEEGLAGDREISLNGLDIDGGLVGGLDLSLSADCNSNKNGVL